MKMRILVVLFFMAQAAHGSDALRYRCDYKYDSEAQGWFKLHIIPANWHEAQLRCYLEGAVLASPLSDHILSNMINILRQQSAFDGIFTGVHATFSRGDFFSVEGVPINKIPLKWATNEPNNLNDEERCIKMFANGTTADVNCNLTLPYICYKKINTNMSINLACGTTDLEYNFDARTGNCYKFHRMPRIWSRAYMTCAAEGGNLVIVNSNQEAAVIKELYAKNQDSMMPGIFYKSAAFVGIHNWNERGDWRTIEGHKLTDAGYNFVGGEPSDQTGTEFCGATNRNGVLIDYNCDKVLPFICEKKPEELFEGCCSDNNIIAV